MEGEHRTVGVARAAGHVLKSKGLSNASNLPGDRFKENKVLLVHRVDGRGDLVVQGLQAEAVRDSGNQQERIVVPVASKGPKCVTGMALV